MANLFKSNTLTTEEFASQIAMLTEKENNWRVESNDSGSVFIFMNGCKIDVDFEYGEFILHKPHVEMEVRLSFEIIDDIVMEEDGTYRMEFNNGMSDVAIERVAE